MDKPRQHTNVYRNVTNSIGIVLQLKVKLPMFYPLISRGS